MPHVDADRNLIFGILALQMDFLTRDALIAGLNAWVLEKSRPIGRVLVDQGALAEDEHDLIDALVNKHLKKHRGDAEESLSALGSSHESAEALTRGVSDPDLRARLERLAAVAEANDPDRTRSYAGAPGDRDGEEGAARFRILRAHAEGGLGRVFVAMDRELNREVALKQIKDEGIGAPERRARFVFEAEVTGGLEHPGIVPVYSSGRYDDGRPYYAMRLIKGETLKEAIRRHHAGEDDGPGPGGRPLALRRLIGRLIAVCNAVGYAHSRGVIHRDLKPSNIMLGRYGETLVVDWGLAKSVDRPDAPGSFAGETTLRPSSGSEERGTMPGSPMGTPQYMSPEQATGRVESVGAASDIYSLGATLYCVLTGRPPFDARVALTDLPVMVASGHFLPPRRVRPDIPRALEAICLKAMARRPEDRYATAMDLAADLERWLADEPVSARREPIAARAGRWVRRHRPIVAASSTLLVASAVGLAISNAMVRRQRDRALAAEAKAEAARVDAIGSLGLARSAVNNMLIKIAEEKLPNVPGLGALRKEVAAEALGFYREFLARNPDDREVRTEAAMILRRVANIERMTGDFPAALPHYEEAEALHRELAEGAPDRPEYRDRWAQFEVDFAEALRMTARADEAMPHYERAHAIARAQLDARPDDPDARRTLALIQDVYGFAIYEGGRPLEGLSRCDEAVAIFADLGSRRPPLHPSDPLLYLMCLVDRAPIQRAAGRLDDAEDGLRLASDRARSLLEQDPNHADARFHLALARCASGTILLEDRGRPAEAEAAFDDAIRDLRRLRAAAPEVRFYRPALAEALSGRADARRALARLADAEADARDAERLLEALVSEEPKDAESLELLATALARHARIARGRGDRDDADALRDRAIARQEAAVGARPDNPRTRLALERLRADRDGEGPSLRP